jgi:cytosine/adenosine deaminase-related metal-dependent hydrolase
MKVSKNWPEGDRIHVSNVNVPASLLDERAPASADAEGLKKVDFVVDGGKLAEILPAGTPAVAPVFDADGGQAWPPFADLHTHLPGGRIADVPDRQLCAATSRLMQRNNRTQNDTPDRCR